MSKLDLIKKILPKKIGGSYTRYRYLNGMNIKNKLYSFFKLYYSFVTERILFGAWLYVSFLFGMRSRQVVRAANCQCPSRNSLEFNLSILRHSGILGAADEAVLNKTLNMFYMCRYGAGAAELCQQSTTKEKAKITDSLYQSSGKI